MAAGENEAAIFMYNGKPRILTISLKKNVLYYLALETPEFRQIGAP